MRTIYLLRHGSPVYPDSIPCCLGKLDVPLSPEGQTQVQALRAYFSNLTLAGVFSSPLQRCRETADALSDSIRLAPGLTELDMGQWDGLSFAAIRKAWPQLYTRRGHDLAGVTPPRR